MVKNRVGGIAPVCNAFSPLSKIANRLQARLIVDGICKNVVDNPDTWRQRAIEEIALQLDICERRQ